MPQTPKGAARVLAKKAGVTFEEYQSRIAKGLKWCYACRDFHNRSHFDNDATRYDGLTALCSAQRSMKYKATRRLKGRSHPKGRSFVPARDGDKRQARRRINFFVESGLIPPPSSSPCTDCGSAWCLGKPRHEYDHHLGYDAEHHEHVQAVCLPCHRKRERARGVQIGRKRNTKGRYA